MMHINNQHFFRCFILTIFLWGGYLADYQLVSAQSKEDVNADLRVFAYGLRYEYTDNPDTELGTYTFYFKSFVPATEGWLVLYYDVDEDDNKNEIGSELGRYEIPNENLATKNANGEHVFSMTKDQIPVDLTEKKAYLGMTWAIELKGDTVVGNSRTATKELAFKPNNDDSEYNYKSYSTDGKPLKNQVKEPYRLMVDRNFQCPQGIAVDNNPQSPFFGRVYVANAPSAGKYADNITPYEAGVVVYEPNPENGIYKKVPGSYMPSGVDFASSGVAIANQRFLMHRIAVNPANGNVYYCKSSSSQQSAIYQLIPDKEDVLMDNGAAINVTEELIPARDYSGFSIGQSGYSELHPINSLAFGPGGELYVMSHAGYVDATNVESCGTGKIYRLWKSDENSALYDNYEQYYDPLPTPQNVVKDGEIIQPKLGKPYNIDPWVSSDNSMVVNARGGFWVAQHRADSIDRYAFLAHIAPDGYEQQSKYGRALSQYFQFAMSTVAHETFSALSLTPLWTTRQFLSPHKANGDEYKSHQVPSGQVAIYEKNGLSSTEAWLAVGFGKGDAKGNRVYVFKLFYDDDNGTWFGFNSDWMFEIIIGGSIDGLAFDYAGNLFIASASSHSLYLYSLPNYEEMYPGGIPVQPLVFNSTTGGRLTEFENNGKTTEAWNNLDRGNPLDDNSVITPARFDLTVDGAIVYDEKYNNSFDTQWSTTDNWNIKRVPDSTDIPVVIRSNAVLDEYEKQSVSGMTIENNSQLTIAHNGGLTIGKGGIKGASKKGVLTLENFSAIWGSEHYANRGAGYLRIHPSVTDMPKVTVHYHTKAQPSNTYPEENAHRLWQYVGAPGKGTIATSTSTTSLYQWKESEGGWVKKTDTRPMKPFVEGYAITQDGAPDYFWTTTAINDNQSIPLSYTPESYRNEGDKEELISGQNVIANSYLAPINVAAFEAEDFEGNIEKTFYLFNTGSWTEWNDAKETPYVQGQSSGHYTAIPTSAAQNFDPSSDPTFIPPMSGIFVRTGSDGGTIKFNYERLVWSWADSNGAANDPMYAPSRVAGQSQQTYAPELLRRIRIQAYGEGSGSDRMYIMQDTRCTSGYDNGWDGENMHAAGQVNIYTNEPCGKMEVSCSNSIDSMYIGFCAGADTIYTLRFTSLIGDSLYIKDLETDSIIALAEEGTYTFHAPAMSVNDMRFQVQLNPEFPAGHPNGNGNSGTTTAIDNVSSSKVWISDNIVYVSTGQEENIVVLCNMHGQVLFQHPFDYQTQLSMAGLPAGVYLMKINNEIYKYVLQ